MKTIDLNSDLGESYGAWRMGDDVAMIEIVSSANIACGFHAGDPAGILRTLEAAARRGVAIGAHVSYPDLAGFGRRDMDIAPADLVADVVYQIGALKGLATTVGATVSYVKPHGALYNRIAVDPVQGAAVIEAIKAIDPSLAMMGLANAPIIAQARAAGLHTVAEAYADRAYTPAGRLVSRREPGAVLHDASLIAERMVHLALHGTIEAIDGSVIAIDAQSLCVHGDSADAVAIAREVRRRLEAAGVGIAAFSTLRGVSPRA
ncbi:MAG: LamB/YcsF family protein [Steroidobacteraceae bacterium]